MNLGERIIKIDAKANSHWGGGIRSILNRMIGTVFLAKTGTIPGPQL